jgi:hypothetical protein
MPKIALINISLGFFIITIAASAGAFVATDLTEAFRMDAEHLQSWTIVLQQSAHGHSSLFGLIHICLGLSIPYSVFGLRVKKLQSLGLFAGTFAMGPLMIIRSLELPASDMDLVGILIGICLSSALIALCTHCAGLTMRALRGT